MTDYEKKRREILGLDGGSGTSNKQPKTTTQPEKKTTTSSNANDQINRRREILGLDRIADVDDNFISSFLSDANSFLSKTKDKINWGNAASSYETKFKAWSDLESRHSELKNWLRHSGDRLDEETYSSISSMLDTFWSNGRSYMKWLKEAKDYYSQWDTEAAYKQSQREQKLNSMSSDQLKAEQKNSLKSEEDKNIIQELMLSNMPYNREYALQDGRDMGIYDEIEQKRKYISEKYGIQFTESSYENDKLLTNLMNGDTIAYTTMDGRNVTWDSLYNNALLDEDLESRLAAYSKNADWAEKSKVISTVADTESDYQIVAGLSRTLVPYDWETAEANGIDRATFDEVEKKRQYINQKYGVDLHSDIYNDINTLNDIMADLEKDDSQKDSFEYMSYLTPEEKSVLSYIYENEGRSAALEWHNSRKGIYLDRYNNYLAEGFSDVGKEAPFWGSVGSVALNLGSGVEYLTDIFDHMATGEPQSNSLALASSSIRSGVSETVDWEIGNWDAFDFVYNTTMSGVDSMVASVLPGGSGGIVLGLSAAAQATNDALNRGMSQGQAFWNGLVSGVFEGLFESWSIGKFNALKEVASAHGKDIALNIARSMLVNASEETLTEIANIAYDSIFNGDFSQYETLVRQYVVNGMTESEAKRKVAHELGVQVVEAGASGALMGLGFGAIGSAGPIASNTLGTAVRDIETGQAIMEADGGVDALKAFGSGADANSKLTKQADKVTGETYTGKGLGKVGAAVKNISNQMAVGKLYRSVAESTVSAQDQANIAKGLESSGFSAKSAKNIADALAAKINGKQLTNFQKSTLETVEGNRKVEEVVNNLFNDAESSMGKRAVDLKKFNFGISLGVGIAPGGTMTGNAAADGKNTTKPQPISESHYEASEEGKAMLDGQEVNLNGLRKTDDGTVMVATSDNQTADPGEVTYPSKGHALIYENYVNIETTTNNPVIANMDVDDRSALAMSYNPAAGVDAKVWFLGSNQAFWYGFEGISMDENTLPENSLVRSIPNDQRAFAYDLGRKAGERATKTQDEGIKAAVEKAVEKLGGKEAAEAAAKKNEGKVILENKIRESTMTKKQRASYELAKVVSKAVGTNVHVYHGVQEYGKYDTNTGDIWININGNFNGSSMMAFTLSHELVHMAKQWSPGEFKAFADYLLEQYGKKGVSVERLIQAQIANAKLNGYTLDEHEAYEEVIADAAMRMLLDSDAVQKMAAYKEQNPGLWQKIIDTIKKFIDKIRKVFEGSEPDSMEAALYKEFDDAAKEHLEKLFVDMVMDAGEHMSTIRNAFGKGTVVEVNADGEFTLAKGKVDGATKFLYNDYTWETGGRDTLRAALEAEGFSQEDIKAALTIMDGKHELVKELAEQFPEQDRINQATVTTDLKDGHSVLSALVSNGDYPVNIDLLMVCKKRKAYQRVINRLCETGLIQQATVDALAIAEINKILGKYGFETACLGCFVESRRLRIQEWAETIVKEWNSEVKKRNPNAKAFGFGKGEATLTQDEVMQLVSELESAGEKNDQGNLNLGQGSAVKRMGVLLDKVPSLRKTLSIEDLITPDGLTALRKFDSNLFSMVKSRYGSNSPKFVQEFNPYNHELAKYGKVPSEYKSLREYLYAIGGARMQSFSDFIVENWFDYCQIVSDLAARKLPMHTYTKEIALAKLFGLTGIKINMSLIPDIDRSLGKEFAGLTRNENGELELIWADKDRFKKTGGKSYMQSINFADAIALQNDPRYSANVGTIAVGVSDNHILMMLDDARIRMIIPYHSSGMNPIFADLMGTSFYKDYTMFQNTTVKQIYNSKGQKVSLKLDKTQTGKLTSGFQFNEVLQELGDARAAAQAYKEWCADASKHTITINGETYTAELTPKFDDFSGHENYYKLLEDFNTYDCISEQAARQGDVQQIYPEDFDKILTDELKAQEGHRQKQVANQAFDKAMAEIESYLKNHTKADTVFYAEQHGVKLSAKDKKLGAEDKKKLADLRKGMKNSLPKVRDTEYMDAVNRGDMETAQKMVGAAAKKAGYDSLVYHGTPRFGFTQIKTEGVEDGVEWSPFFASDSLEVAETYSGKSKVKSVADDVHDGIDEISEAFHDKAIDLCEYINRAAGYQSYISYDAFDNFWEDAAHGTLSMDVIRDSFYEDVESIIQELFPYSEYYEHINDADVDQDELYEQFVESDEIDRIYSAANDIDFILREARADNGGNYQFYANTDNLLEIDAKGNSWARIPFDEYDKNGFHPYVNTRQAATYAKLNGFDGVKVANVFDDGGRSTKKQRTPATVYIFFEPQKQVKSADPVTYDDSGDVIPLSERFNQANNDIRYSMPKTNSIEQPTDNKYIKMVEDGATHIGEYDVVPKSKEPKKTILAWKALVVKPGAKNNPKDKSYGNMYPPQVHQIASTPYGVWLYANEAPKKLDKDGNPVLTKYGRPKVKEGMTYRPAWHFGDAPYASQFRSTHGFFDDDGVRRFYMSESKGILVWALCEMAADENYQDEADMAGHIGENRYWDEQQASLWYLPENGYYKYMTNRVDPNSVTWYLSDKMRIVQTITDAEMREILTWIKEDGSTDLEFNYPLRIDGKDVDPADYGVPVGNVVGDGIDYVDRWKNQFREIALNGEIDITQSHFYYVPSSANNYGSYETVSFSKEVDDHSQELIKTKKDAKILFANSSSKSASIQDFEAKTGVKVKDGKTIAGRKKIIEAAKNEGYDIVEFAKEANGLGSDVVIVNPDSVIRNYKFNNVSERHGRTDAVKYAMPKAQNQPYRKPAYDEWDVGDALDEALDHADLGYDNLIKVGNMPNFITDLIGIEGEFYIYRNHAYENMVSMKDAEKAKRPTVRGGREIHFHNLGKERMTEAILSLENPIMTIADSQEYGNPQIVMILPVRGNNDSPLYAALSFYSNTHIKGEWTKKPHIVLTISERGMVAEGGFDGHLEVINKAVESGNVLSFDKEKMRDYLSVIANHTRVGNITSKSLADNIARFREFVNKFREKNNIDYKLPNSGGVSSRQLLADAFDELVQTPQERELMDQYRNNISKVEEVQERLRKLRGEISKLTKSNGDKAKIASMNKTAAELADLIDKYDRKLLDLEASKPLKDVLARAKSAAYREARERSEKDLKEYRQQVSDRFDRGVDSRRKTAMRQKIRKVIRDLDKILNRGDKKRNVKEDMKDFVAEALASAEVLFTDNYTNEDIIRNGFGVELSKEEAKYLEEARAILEEMSGLPTGGYEAWQARQEAEEKLKSKLAYRMSKLKDAFFRERQMLNKAEVADVLGKLADAYAKLETSEYAYVNGAYHEAVYEYLKMLQEDVGGAKVKDMTLGQLEELYKAYTMVLTTVQNANKMFADDLKQSKEELANRVMMEVYQAGGEHGLWSKGQLARNQASWNNTKPIYAAERTGSSTFVKLVKGLFKGQYNWATDMEEAKAFRQKVAAKYGFKNWDMEKTYKFTSTSGIDFELNLNQIMSLYAYAKREQAHDHLLKGGFVFGKNTEVVVTKNGIKRTYLNKSAKAHNISDEIMGEIVGKLSKEQRAFVDEMQDYLSTTMGEKGNEVSMRLYGVKLFMEKFYFPLRSAGQFKEKAKEADLKQQQGQISIVNSGFTKAVTPKASNPVVLDGFTDVWAGHVNEMSLYHSMVLPMEDFRRVYNYASPNMEGQESASVNSFIENAYGDAATGYFDQLYNELNGGAIVDPRENLSKQMIGKFKKSAVMLSNSVWVQQFSAIGRAYALIDPKYFIGSKVDKKKHAALWAEMKQYAPVAIIKEMGGFDTHTGLSAKDYLLAEEYGKGERVKGLIKDSQYRDEIMGLLPAKADELTWCAIWEAVKRETKTKNPKMDVKSEEFLKKAGERFSEVIEKTQVYDSVLARSANMRSKNGLMQMLTAFMAEPTTTVNMVEDALRKGDKKAIARTFGAAAASIILNNALASIIYAMRDDDEDETFLEKYSQAFASGMLDDINPMTYYPVLKDIWSLFQGYDVERSDMAIYSDIADSVKKTVQLIAAFDSDMDEEDAAEYYKKVADALMSLLDAGASAFGVPWKNVRRDLVSYYNTFNTLNGDWFGDRDTTWSSFVDAVGGSALDSIPIVGLVAGKSNTDKLYDAIVSGNTAYVNRLKSGYKDEDAYSNAIRKALRENDPRIQEAAEAQINGNPSERVRIAKLIIADGFAQDDVVRAINAEINAMTSSDSESTKKEKGFYTAEDFAREIANGDQSSAYAVKADIIATAQKNGKSQDDAEDSFVSSAKSNMKKLFLDGKLSESKAVNALVTYCGEDEEDAQDIVGEWEFESEYGFSYSDRGDAYKSGEISAYDLKTVLMEEGGKTSEEADLQIEVYDWEKQGYGSVTAAAIREYNEHCAASDVPKDVYLHIRSFANNTENDKDANGKTIYYSAMRKIMAEIDEQYGLTSSQKTAIARSLGWAEKNISKYKLW